SEDDTLDGGADNDILTGLGGNDTLSGGDGVNRYIGGAGDDTLVGGTRSFTNEFFSDFDRADYSSATSGISVTLSGGLDSLANSSVSGDASVGTDSLVNIDSVIGTDFADSFVADSTFFSRENSSFNEFEGGGGNDTITGNGTTRVSYRGALDSVTVDFSLLSGQAQSTNAGDTANVGVDTFVSGVTQVRGSDFDDFLFGSDGNSFESFRGQAGNDYIDGRDGTSDRADYLNSPSGVTADLSVLVASTIVPAGPDVTLVQDGYGTTDEIANIEEFRGSEFADTITAGANTSFIDGRGGNDILIGGSGIHTLRGGAGDDRLEGSGITVDSNNEFNRVDYRDATDGVTVQLGGGVNANEGTAFSTNVGDTANIGVDTLVNAEFAFGSEFADTVTVNTGYTNRFNGFFEFEGRGGDDTINVLSTDLFVRASYQNAAAGVEVDLEAGTASSIVADDAGVGTDTFTPAGVDSVRGSDFGDNLLGRNTTTQGDQLRPRAGNDFVDGRGGLFDEVRYSSTSNDVIIDLGVDNQTTSVTTTSDGFGGTDTLINIENIRSGSGHDQLSGDVNNNRLRGGSGDDTLDGKGGNDELRGEDGNDVLIGGTGNDLLIGGFGDNTLRGGAGNDTLIGASEYVPIFEDVAPDFNRVDYRDATGGVTVNLVGGLGSTSSTASGAGVGTDTLINPEFLYGSAFADTVILDASFAGYRGGSFFEFEGGGGDDVFTNMFANSSNARIGFRTALDGVTVDLDAGTAFSTNAGDTAGIGFDTFTNVGQVRGSDFDDTMFGRVGLNDFFRPRDGDDFVDGRTGNDEVRYTFAQNAINVDLNTGTASGVDIGTDTLVSIERIRGGFGDDTLVGDSLDNRIRGGGGDDAITGNDGNDDLRGESGNDTIEGGIGDDTLAGGSGNDTLIGGADFDTANYSNEHAGITVDMSAGVAGDGTATDGYGDTDTLQSIEQVIGTDFNDRLIGSVGDDILVGGFGDNTLRGGAGNDTLQGEGILQNSRFDFNRVDYSDALDDVTILISGGIDSTSSSAFSTNAGDTANIGTDVLINAEYVFGSAFDDTVTVAGDLLNRYGAFFEFEGGDGNDSLTALAPNVFVRASYLNASAGVDVNLETGTASSINANDAGIGIDTLSGVDSVRGSDFDDVIVGRNSTTEGDQIRPRAGNDTVDGGGGLFDEIRYSSTSNDVIVDLGVDNQTTAVTTGSDGFGGTDTLINFERIRSGGGNDQLSGDINDNRLRGGSGDDTLNGRGGSDQLLGESGNDLLIGGSGNDSLDGGSDFDTADYSATTSGVIVDLAAGTATGTEIGSDTITSVERVLGGSGNDTLGGSTGADTLEGGAGADTLNGLAGNDTIILSVANFASVDGGIDQDTLQLDGSLNLDFGTLSGTIAGIEAIDLNTSNTNTLSLNEQDVINLSGDANTDFTSAAATQIPGTQINTSENILIDGNAADSVNLNSNGAGVWQDTGQTVTSGGESYSVFNYVDGSSILASVAIDNEVNTTIN
ncbi:MAG: calcium-binding protein, partial [Pseudomonadota bacterium]